jgi:hypothetical protein
MTDGLLLSPNRLRLYCLGLFIVGLALFPVAFRHVTARGTGSDWSDFWAAGSEVGTKTLLDPAAHRAWGEAHLIPATAFVYMPATAWLYAPAAHMSMGASFLAYAFAMLIVCVFAAMVAAKAYGLAIDFTVPAILGWAPTTAAILTGQNSPLGMLLALLAVLGYTRDRWILCGFAVGLMLYKPTYAAPFVLLLLFTRQWRALALVASSAGAWYLLSVVATGGQWSWPVTYAHALAGYVGPDFVGNAAKAVSLPGVLTRWQAPIALADGIGALLLVCGAFALSRVPKLEASSFAGLLGLAASPHAWAYDATLAIPTVFYVVTHTPEPWRRRLLFSSYLLAPLWQFSNRIGFDTLAVIVLGGTIAWFVSKVDTRAVAPAH